MIGAATLCIYVALVDLTSRTTLALTVSKSLSSILKKERRKPRQDLPHPAVDVNPIVAAQGVFPEDPLDPCDDISPIGPSRCVDQLMKQPQAAAEQVHTTDSSEGIWVIQ